MNKEGSVYLVTGGYSGLGEGAAETLLAKGAFLTILDLQLPADDSYLTKHEDRVLFLQVDTTIEKDVLNAIDATKRKFGKLNGVINCEEISLVSPIYDFKKNQPHSLQEFTKIVNVNLIGTFNVIRLAIPLLLENEPNLNGERGVIVNTSSVAGHQGIPEHSAYSASKAGIVGLTNPLAKELGNIGIRVLDIAPGLMDTPTITEMDLTLPNDHPDGVVPKGKGKPSEFGHLVKTVIENGVLNGTSIKLDGVSK